MLKRFCSAATAEVARLERRAHNTRRVRRKRARTLNAVQGVLRGLFGGGALDGAGVAEGGEEAGRGGMDDGHFMLPYSRAAGVGG